jgi:UDP-N-acetylmuramate: L-alanyl-gamma-D-glutamyl-meso-diaminopimelate ligase
MRAGVHRDTLAESLRGADSVWLYAGAELGWDPAAALATLGARAHLVHDLDALLAGLSAELHAGDHALLMSNGGFGGLHERLLGVLAARGDHA